MLLIYIVSVFLIALFFSVFAAGVYGFFNLRNGRLFLFCEKFFGRIP